MSTTVQPFHVAPTSINPRAVRLVEAFRTALLRLRAEHGLTFRDVDLATTLLSKLQQATGAPLAAVAIPLFSEIFQNGGGTGYTPSHDVASPTYVPGSPKIGNPGTLPMRPHEPGVPLVAFGRVLDGQRRPLRNAELVIYHASNDGIYSGLYDDGQPKFNLRARQLTDDDGRYHFTTITPVPYTDAKLTALEGLASAANAIGRSLYRPAHIHYEVHHPDLVTPWCGEIYFAGDPVIAVDFVGPEMACAALQATTVLHDGPDQIAQYGFQGPFHTAEFDFILKTRSSPDIVAPPHEPA